MVDSHQRSIRGRFQEMVPMPNLTVTDEQVAFFKENGYIQFFDVLDNEEIERAREALDEALAVRHGEAAAEAVQSDYDKVFLQRVNLWCDHEGYKDYVFTPEIAEAARRLSGSKAIRLWHDHALIKMPGDSKASPWHQDLPYWPMKEEGALSCWMALDDVKIDNGCMQFIPKSHRWGRLEPVNLVTPQDVRSVVPDPDNKDFTPVPMEMPAGSCTFHYGLTFHYAGPNLTERPRRAIVTIYMPDGYTYTGGEHPVTDDLGLKPGDPLVSDRFPLLAEE
jgi:ectoine hydroxylase-related dioxygenase (phytanoyl-CoA dioxygenase family)